MKQDLTGRLNNGIKYYIYNSESKYSIKFLLLNKSGSMNEEEYINGTAHLLEHMCLAFYKFSKDDLFDAFNREMNIEHFVYTGYTDFDRIVLRAYSLKKFNNIDDGLNIINSMITGRCLNEKYLEDIRQEVISECNDFKSRNYVQSQILEFITDGDFKYMPMGSSNSIREIQYEDLLKFQRNYFRPENLAIIVIGDVNLEHTEKKIKEKFAFKNKVNIDKNDATYNMEVYQDNRVKTIVNYEKENVVKVYYRFNYNTNTIKNRLIMYFVDAMLKQYLEKEMLNNKLKLSEVMCLRKMNVYRYNYYMIIFKFEDSINEDFEDTYSNIINKLLKYEIEEREFDKQKNELLDIIKIIHEDNEAQNTEEVSIEYINNFFEEESVMMIKKDYNLILSELEYVNYEHINDLIKQIVKGCFRMVKLLTE